MEFTVREARWEDLDGRDHLVLGCIGDEIVATCVLLIVPNLTYGRAATRLCF